MMKIRPDTRTAILEAGFLTFDEDPTASLSDVAARAGVGRATLHRHFASRDDLMLALTLEASREIREVVEEATVNASSYSQALRLALDAIIPLAPRQAFLSSESAQNAPAISEQRARDVEELHETIDASKAEGLFAPDIPTTWIAQSYDALIYAAWQLVRDGDATPRQAADLAWRTLTSGMGSTGDDR